MRDTPTTTGAIAVVCDFFDPARLIGPVFDKELRVASRRRRNYFLRCAYVVALSFFILFMWYSASAGRGPVSATYQASRLSAAARQMISTIVWFQFLSAQVLAVVMLASAISDEIRAGTLSVLMTTPVSNFQIVTGKIASRLLQILLLLAVSLPLLAIVRVFGGVPWDFVVSSVCITLTVTLLTGALSLFLSMMYRNAYTVILVALMIYVGLFGALAGLFNMLAVKGMFVLDRQATQSLLAMTNPFMAFAATTAKFIQAGVPASFSWPLHCLLMLGVAAVLVAASVWRVRKAALGGAFGSAAKLRPARVLERKLGGIFDRSARQSSEEAVIPVTGAPVVWKEMRKGFIGRGKGDVAVFMLSAGAFLIAAVVLLLSSRRNFFLPRYFLSAFWLVVMVRMAVFSAGCITGEKEGRTWPVLLLTPLEDRDIIRGKAIAAFRRNMPLLLMYLTLICIMYFKMAPNIAESTLAIAFNLLPLLASILFIMGAGLYFGTVLRTTTAAVAATIGLHFALSYLFCGGFSPFLSLLYGALLYRRSRWPYFVLSIVRTLIVGAVGLSLMRSARRRVRRNIF